MDQQQIIRDLDVRAAALGLSMRDICLAAKLHPTTVSRWKLTPRNPSPVSANMRSIQSLMDVLNRVEEAKEKAVAEAMTA